jgi:hypothetical protein
MHLLRATAISLIGLATATFGNHINASSGMCTLKLWLLLLHVAVPASGDMITEEALPTYMAMLNTLDGVRDETGASPTPWGQWTRMWVAEENRHGDLMNKYMYLTGRCV